MLLQHDSSKSELNEATINIIKELYTTVCQLTDEIHSLSSNEKILYCKLCLNEFDNSKALKLSSTVNCDTLSDDFQHLQMTTQMYHEANASNPFLTALNQFPIESHNVNLGTTNSNDHALSAHASEKDNFLVQNTANYSLPNKQNSVLFGGQSNVTFVSNDKLHSLLFAYRSCESRCLNLFEDLNINIEFL